MRSDLRRGDIWIVTADKLRPAIVLTRDRVVTRLNSVTVVPVTTTCRGLITEVALGGDEGLRFESWANLDNVTSLAVNRFVKRVGRATPQTMELICRALTQAIDC